VLCGVPLTAALASAGPRDRVIVLDCGLAPVTWSRGRCAAAVREDVLSGAAVPGEVATRVYEACGLTPVLPVRRYVAPVEQGRGLVDVVLRAFTAARSVANRVEIADSVSDPRVLVMPHIADAWVAGLLDGLPSGPRDFRSAGALADAGHAATSHRLRADAVHRADAVVRTDAIELTDPAGRRVPDVLAEHGVELARVGEAGARLERLDAYLELHVEQGPVLEARGDAVTAVTGTAGTERRRLRFTGRSGHAGTVPMRLRRDPLSAAARTVLAVEEGARRHGGVGTVGAIRAQPGIPTAIPGEVELWLDQRHAEAGPLAAMLEEALEAAAAAARAHGVELTVEPVWSIEPIPFDARLVELARAAAGGGEPIPSGALHDASEVARAGVPTAMLFVQSLGGVSHAPDEDSRPEHLRAGVEALGRLAAQALAS